MHINLESVLKFTTKIASESDAIFVTELLEQFALAASWQEDKATHLWAVEILFEKENIQEFNQCIQLINKAFKISIESPEISNLEQRDWLRENQESFPPFDVGNFYIYGSHILNPTPNNLLPLKVDAATAFGSGNHGSTKGCLLALSKLADINFDPTNVLDMGCGSGILAMAAARSWPNAPITASDIDSECVRVTIENCDLNNLPHIDVLEGNGFQNEKIQNLKPYNLIIANILATVLCEIATDISAALSENGLTILSGILEIQKDMVVRTYNTHGLNLYDFIQIDEWVTLIMKK